MSSNAYRARVWSYLAWLLVPVGLYVAGFSSVYVLYGPDALAGTNDWAMVFGLIAMVGLLPLTLYWFVVTWPVAGLVRARLENAGFPVVAASALAALHGGLWLSPLWSSALMLAPDGARNAGIAAGLAALSLIITFAISWLPDGRLSR